jgi:hypothetical protein
MQTRSFTRNANFSRGGAHHNNHTHFLTTYDDGSISLARTISATHTISRVLAGLVVRTHTKTPEGRRRSSGASNGT